MKATIFHNPHCSKSRQTLSLLEENKVDADIVEYLTDTPDEQALRNVLDMLGLEPRQLMRTHEKPYKENNLDDSSLSHDQLIAAMIANPILIERPIVIVGNKAVIGRPPENILTILED